MTPIIVRKGEKSDLSQALNLVKELARYEHAPDEVELTLEEMEQDGFGPAPIFEFFVAEENSRVVGIALYYQKYSTWKGRCLFLEDIVVTESHRRAGIGKQLFDAVLAVAKEKKVRRLEWQVLDWNEPAIQFYKKYGATLDPEWMNGKLVYDQIQQFR